MIITEIDLNYIFGVVKYLHFSIDIGDEIPISKLSKERTRKQFVSTLEFIIDKNICALGGFSIRYTDDKRDTIKKVPSLYIKPVEGHVEQHKVLPFHFEKTKEGRWLVQGEKYKDIFNDGRE